MNLDYLIGAPWGLGTVGRMPLTGKCPAEGTVPPGEKKEA